MDKNVKTALIAGGVLEGLMFFVNPGFAIFVNGLAYTTINTVARIESYKKGDNVIDRIVKELEKTRCSKTAKVINYTFYPEKLAKNIYDWYVKRE